MKSKLILLLLFALFVQTSKAQVFGAKGGVNIANISISSNGMGISPKSIVGFHFGPVAEFKLQDNLFINSGLLYSLKGYKVKTDIEGINVEGSGKVNYLEIPLNLAYKFAISEANNFFTQAGPYFGYALSGKEKINGETEDMKFGDGGMRRFDFGLGIALGLEFGSVVPSVSYQFGLANLADDPDVTVKNKVFQISVAYMFGK